MRDFFSLFASISAGTILQPYDHDDDDDDDDDDDYYYCYYCSDYFYPDNGVFATITSFKSVI